MLLGTSALLEAVWPYLLALVLAGALLLTWSLRQPALKARWDALILRLPLIGPLLAATDAARFARTMSIATAAAVPVLEALRLASRVVSLAPMNTALKQVAVEVREGAGLATSLGQSRRFPPLLVRLLASGEKSGQVETMLDHAAELMEQRISRSMARLLAILEPMIILVMGAVVLLIVLAIMLPIFQLNRIIAS